MTQVIPHGDEKYRTSERVGATVTFPTFAVEQRRFVAGAQTTVLPMCNELVVLTGGGGVVARHGDGQLQKTMARPGMTYIVPAGTHERSLELSSAMECLHLYLPVDLIERSAMADFDIDPARVHLAYIGGLRDEAIYHICLPMKELLGRPREATDALFIDGIKQALSAHLVGKYSADKWRPAAHRPTLDQKRLRRVLDYIEASLDTEIRLDDLAAEACLSPYHFSRLFKRATGLTPHRYVTDRRVQLAQQKLAQEADSLVDIALDCGFGSQANFTRVFRKTTGLTPGQFRALCHG